MKEKIKMPQVVSVRDTNKVLICLSLDDLRACIDDPATGHKMFNVIYAQIGLTDALIYTGIKGKIKDIARKL